MATTCKFYKYLRYVSYDSGTTWLATGEYDRGELYEANSSDCGYVPPTPEPQYRTTSGTPYCNSYDKYVDIYSQVSFDNGSTWETTATTSTLVEANSTDCGAVLYRWVDTGNEGCDGCELGEGVKSLIVGNETIPDSVQTHTYFLSFDDIVTSGDLLVGPSSYYDSRSGGTSLCLGEGVTNVDCSNKRAITTLILPDTVSSCTPSLMMSLTELIIPLGVTNIGYEMFYHCDNLTSVTLSSGVTYIGNEAFNYCSKLQTIILQAPTPPELGTNPFDRTPSSLIIYVPRESLELYKNAWGNNYNIQAFN